MGTTRIEQAIDDFDCTLGEDGDGSSCDDIRLAWLAGALQDGDRGEDEWTER